MGSALVYHGIMSDNPPISEMFDVGKAAGKAFGGMGKRTRTLDRHWRKWDAFLAKRSGKESPEADFPESHEDLVEALQADGLKVGMQSAGDDAKGYPPMIEVKRSPAAVNEWIEKSGADEQIIAVKHPEKRDHCAIVPRITLEREDWSADEVQRQMEKAGRVARGIQREGSAPEPIAEGKPHLSDIDVSSSRLDADEIAHSFESPTRTNSTSDLGF